MKYLHLLCLLTLFGSSCVKDNSTGRILPIDDILIEGIEDTLRVSMDDNLIIDPKVTSKMEKTEEDLDFVWYSYTNTSQFVADTLGKNRKLQVAVAMSPGTYDLVLRVTDRSTGIFYKYNSKLQVVNDFTTGIMILAETGGKSMVHFLNTVSGKFIEDAYGKGNEGAVAGSNPVSITYNPQNFSFPAEVLILNKDLDGGVVINPVTFKKDRVLRNSFLTPWQGSDIIQSQGYVGRGGGLQDYIIIDGQLHNRSVNAGDIKFKPGLLGDYYLSTMYFNEGASRSGFYDNKNMRFLCHNNTSGSLNQYLSGSTIDIIDPNKVNLKLIYSGTVSSNEYFGLFEDPSGQNRWLLRFAMNSLSQSFTAKEKFIVTAADIMNAEKYASSSALQNYLFYSIGNAIYVYNIVSKSGGKILDLGSNIQIDFMEMNGVELKVGFRDHTKTTLKGGFATYGISTLGGINAQRTRLKEGICDRIVDLTDKK
ncbi:PKD-like family lipoprotein [Sphingobacterium faecale]|uniref:PKD family protein n=1 Tax=Sphingobacterium faecale TaxID=2803775 RepID=A0ABS1R2Y3_9SPHI|nr:PKD-like family lipoprotein [Sphingobacterium faecale]MBL1409023.1 hypothetical protein [Sphingobacterium faecale]